MKYSHKLIPILVFSLLSACGKEHAPPSTHKETAVKYEKSVILQGAVSNNSGLLKTGKITAKSLNGDVLAETILENSARYQLQVPAGSLWPVLLHYVPEKANDDNEKMLSVAIQPTTTKYDINPMTTAIAKQAKLLGGYTLSNLTRAAEERVHVPDANKTSTGFRGDPTTQYGGWH
ncbi:hypothetical protein [Methylomonas sp. AM2-LC]|uniref:hypothetical protein n=1 Tax=Methylomonas sp. AM2-LC TaxID=3153301 RepID=UPI00326421D4